MSLLPRTRQLRSEESWLIPFSPSDSALSQAFAIFSNAAESLENTYHALHEEISILRGELTGTNERLAASLAENSRTTLYLESILRSLPCGVIVADSEGRVLKTNPAIRRLFDLVPETQHSISNKTHSVSGTEFPYDSLGGDEYENLLMSQFQLPTEFCVCGTVEAEIEFSGRDRVPNESPRTYGVRRTKLTKFAEDSESQTNKGSSENSPFHTPEEWVYIIRDLTEEKALLREREAARRLTSLAEVSAVLAHEIRNPLASLELFAGLIAQSSGPSDDLSCWIKHIRAGLRTLSGTVNNVLQLYSQSKPEATPTDLQELLGQTVEFLQPLADQWQIRIVYRTLQSTCMVSGVAYQLQQVWINLATNAFRASKPGSTLTIALRRCAGKPRSVAIIEFADEGAGIPADLLERIFEPGFSTRPDSPGIGLAVSRKIIEQHGGEIRACSTLGQGSRFIMEVPCLGPSGPNEPIDSTNNMHNEVSLHEPSVGCR